MGTKWEITIFSDKTTDLHLLSGSKCVPVIFYPKIDQKPFFHLKKTTKIAHFLPKKEKFLTEATTQLLP